MHTRTWRRIATAGLGCALLSGAAPAGADYFGAPTLSAASIEDDNLFFSPTDAQEDSILRVSPAVEGGYRTEAVNWRGWLGVEAERYEQHAELDSDHAREGATFEILHRGPRRVSLAANASLQRTQSPGELAPESGLEFERRQAERFALAPSLAFHVDRRVSTFAGYGFTRDALDGAPRTDTHELSLGIGRRDSRRDTTSLEYRYRRLESAAEAHASHAVLGGATVQFDERTTGSLLAGPRIAEGSVDWEAAVSLRRALGAGELSFEYARTETTVIGVTDTATTQSLGASAGAAAGTVVDWRIASGLARTESGGNRADALTFDLSLGVRITRLTSVLGTYAHRAQQGRLDVGDGAQVERNVVMLAVVIRAPERDEREEQRRARTRRPSMHERPWNVHEPESAEEEEVEVKEEP